MNYPPQFINSVKNDFDNFKKSILLGPSTKELRRMLRMAVGMGLNQHINVLRELPNFKDFMNFEEDTLLNNTMLILAK